MKFYGTLKVYRYEENWNPEITEIFAEHFEAKSIQAAKRNSQRSQTKQNCFRGFSPGTTRTREYTARIYAGSPGAVRYRHL